jgi:hypothetical protein
MEDVPTGSGSPLPRRWSFDWNVGTLKDGEDVPTGSGSPLPRRWSFDWKVGTLVGVLGGVGIRVVRRVAEAEVALVALLTAIRPNVENPLEQKLDRAAPSGPADGRASTVWTTSGSREGKHGPHLSIWPGKEVYTQGTPCQRRISDLEYRN